MCLLRRIFVKIFLFQNDAFFFVDFALIKFGMLEHIGKNIQTKSTWLCRGFDKIAGDFFAGKSVEFSTDAVNQSEAISCAVGRFLVPLKAMCSKKWEIPLFLRVS